MREKNVHGVLIVPNGTSTFSELENQKKNLMRAFRGRQGRRRPPSEGGRF